MRFRIFFCSILILLSTCQAKKISGDAAPEKAQEPIKVRDIKLIDLDSSIRLPSPPQDLITIGPPGTFPSTTISPEKSEIASSPAQPPSTLIEPPAVEPIDVEESSTLTPPPISSTSSTDGATTTFLVTIEPSTTIEVIVEDDLDNEISDIQKADVEQEDQINENDIKELIEKTEINKTADFYITSSIPPTTSVLNDSSIDDDMMINFDELFDKKVESSTIISSTQAQESSTSEFITSTSEPISTTIVEKKVPHKHSKTCIHIEQLKNIDNNTKHMKTGTIEVSVELQDGEKLDSAEKSEETSEEQQGEAEIVERKTRENQEPAKWKKYEMDCSAEEDEKGEVCKLWAKSGLCMTNKPTMFLFCRKTCLCIGPSN